MAFDKVAKNHTEQWYQLVSDASCRLGYAFDESVESYVVLTLDQYVTDLDLPRRTAAIDLLDGMNQGGRGGFDKLRQTGDRCLIISGFFPERAERFNLSTNYFIDIGQQAYHTLSHRRILKCDPVLFDKLCHDFVRLTHVLLAMRKCN